MKREILFRGKCIFTGIWVEGNYIEKNNPQSADPKLWAALIHDRALTTVQVDPETVGQFTGLVDKAGNKIFEGDIAKTNTDKPMVISWSNRHASFTIEREGWAFRHYFGDAMEANKCEVIGNIHDNPELLINLTP